MRLLLLASLLLVTACGADKAPAAPSTTVTVLGEWRGEWQPQTCVEANAAGGCSALAGGTIRMLFSGSLTEHEGTVTLGALVIPVSGTATTTGAATLAGSKTENGVATTIADGQAVVSGTTITGSYTYTSAAADSVVTATVTFFGVKVGSSGGPSRTLP
ncbi:MAG: hypothetical protein AB7P99_20585 [Vicinamibacterales bacterium]